MDSQRRSLTRLAPARTVGATTAGTSTTVLNRSATMPLIGKAQTPRPLHSVVSHYSSKSCRATLPSMRSVTTKTKTIGPPMKKSTSSTSLATSSSSTTKVLPKSKSAASLPKQPTVKALPVAPQEVLPELRTGDGPFDPMNPAYHADLLAKLGVGMDCSITAMEGFRGGLNEGIWFLKDKSGGQEVDLVLKLVRGHRLVPSLPTEGENLAKLRRENSSLAQDTRLAFPIGIFACIDSQGEKKHELIVMRRVPGVSLTDVIQWKLYNGQVDELMLIMERLGACLSEFHGRHGDLQHGDCQPSNVFYDRGRGEFTLIDIGGMGIPTAETDIEHFGKALGLLANGYGHPELATNGLSHFKSGYTGASLASGALRWIRGALAQAGVSPQVFVEHLGQDGSGGLGREQLDPLLFEFEPKFTNAEANTIFRYFDKNLSGSIELPEFCKRLDTQPTPYAGSSKPYKDSGALGAVISRCTAPPAEAPPQCPPPEVQPPCCSLQVVDASCEDRGAAGDRPKPWQRWGRRLAAACVSVCCLFWLPATACLQATRC